MKLELWIDSIDNNKIADACSFGLLHGVTTNPTLLSKSELPPIKQIYQLLDIQAGPVAIQVTANTALEMLKQAEYLSQISERIIVKIPCTRQGYQAMKSSSQKGVKILATAIYEPRQFVIAQSLGAQYAAVYFNRMIKQLEDKGSSANEALNIALEKIKEMLALLDDKTSLMLAAIKDSQQVDALLSIGVTCLTLSEQAYQEWTKDNSNTLKDLKKFEMDWHQAGLKDNWMM